MGSRWKDSSDYVTEIAGGGKNGNTAYRTRCKARYGYKDDDHPFDWGRGVDGERIAAGGFGRSEQPVVDDA